MTTVSALHLWEVEHPFYCEESNSHNNAGHTEFASWADFLDDQKDLDLDLNLVFRWDWIPPSADDDDEKNGPIPWEGDENYRDSELLIFWHHQRTGRYRSSSVAVCRADEPAVKEWLTLRFHHLLKLWTPLPFPTQ